MPSSPVLLSTLMLLAVAMVWGTSYGVAKSALLVYPVLGLLALRFGITTILLLPALRHLRGVRLRTLLQLLGTGGVLLAIFLCETFGLLLTQASHAALLISLCVVFTPAVEWVLLGRRPTRAEWSAAALSLAGAALLTGAHGFAMSHGDALILLAALLRAANTCLTKRTLQDARPLPTLTVTAVQSGVVAGGSLLAAFALGAAQWQRLPSFEGHPMFWSSVLYLVLACTLFAFFAQNYAIRHSSPTRVALLMGSEPVFGALFAVLWLGESMTPAAWVGGALIVAAAGIAVVRGPGGEPVVRRTPGDVVPAWPAPR